MTRTRHSRIWPVVASAAVVVIAGGLTSRPASGQEAGGPPPRPIGASELLRSEPFDRLTLIDNSVLIVEPVSPRPLPVIDPKKERERRKQGSAKNAASLVEVGAVEKKGQDEAKQEDSEALETLKIHLMQGGRNEIRDFQLKRSSLKKIEYFEDLLLEEVDRLVLARDFARAFECCLRVRSRNPGWAGLEDCVNRVLFAEGRRALMDGDDERGLRLLRELLGRKRDYPGLLDQIAEAYGKRIDRAVRLGLYVRGRRVLHELVEVTGELSAVRALRALFITRATERMKQGESGESGRTPGCPGRRPAHLADPPGAEEQYVKAFEAEPTLEVGVTDVASPLGPWIHSRADARVNHLLYRPLLASDDEEARQGKRPGQLAASVETSDLGRRLMIRLRPGPNWSDGSRPVSAIDLAHALIERSDPHSPSYEARWADLLDRVEVRDESRVEVRLNHTPLKAGGWLLGAVGPAHAGDRRPRGHLAQGAHPGHRRHLSLRAGDRRRHGAAAGRRSAAGRPRPGDGEPVPKIRRVTRDPDVAGPGRGHGAPARRRHHDRPRPARPGRRRWPRRPRSRSGNTRSRSCTSSRWTAAIPPCGTGRCAGASRTPSIARVCSRRPC